MSSKQFGTSRGSNSVGNRLAGRYATAGPAEEHQEQPPAARAETAPAKPAMVTRSWYLPRAAADALTGTADRLWRDLPGTSKHEVLAALLETAVAHSDEARQRLSQISQD